MLSLLLGTTGSGKTTALRERVCGCVQDGGKAIVLVPEQYSFETEKALYEKLGAAQAINAEVLSFTRLCNHIFRQYGGLAGDYIDDSARLLLMHLALTELKDTLCVYSRKIHNAGFVQTLVTQMSEFKNAGVAPEQLERFADDSGTDALADKTRELSAVYSVYQAMIERGYQDAEDDVTRACGYLECEQFFAGCHVFIDSFKSFTAGEYQLLSHIIAQADGVTVALCTDTLEETESGMGLFSLVKKTAARLTRIATEHEAPVDVHTIAGGARYQSAELAHLERNIFRAHPSSYEHTCKDVTLVQADSQYDEIEYVAAKIGEAVRGGMRYRDIAVLGRDLDGYRQALESTFERFDVPFFMDVREDITDKPLTAALLHAVGAARRGYDTDEILALLKTSLPGVPVRDIGELENYCFTWDIRGAMWLNSFNLNPSGFGKPEPEDTARLARLNAVRERIIQPLAALHDSIQRCDGAGFASAVFLYLEQSGILALLRAAEEENPIAQDCAQLYDTVVELLEQFASALAGVNLSPARFEELLRLALGAIDLGSIPQTLDQVLVGSADRVRTGTPLLTFLVGANEGVFPAAYQQGGIFTDAERERMIGFGIEITDTAQTKALDETFCAYSALCCASNRLYVCYPASTIRGAALYPSAIVKGLKGVLPAVTLVKTENADRMLYIQNNKTAFDVLCASLRQNNQFTASLAEHLRGAGYAQRIERLLHPIPRTEYQLHNIAVIRRLYGADIRISPSKLDSFSQCKMAYFCRYGLGARPRRRAELSPMESGAVVHYALQTLLLRHKDLSAAVQDEKALRAELRALLEEYIAANMGGQEGKTARFQYLFTRILNTLVKLVVHLAKEFAVSDFRPAYFELPIQKQPEDGVAAVQPLEFPIATGGTAYVEGIVDRVDLMTKNGRKYLRVVDYKTGGKEFNFTDVYCGMNLQMLIYLFTLAQKGEGELAHATPAGILYMPAKTKFTLLERAADDDTAQSAQMATLRMNGLLLDSLEALAGMERDGGGRFIPVTIGQSKAKAKDESDSKTVIKGPVATLAEFGKLQQRVEKAVTDMANTLREGQIGALPTFTENFHACDYCEYRAVCGREDGDAKIDAEKVKDKDAFFEKLTEEAQHGGSELDPATEKCN